MECWNAGLGDCTAEGARSRQRFAKDIFTTKNAKTTKDSEINDYKLRTTVLKSFRSLRKFSVARGYSKRDLLAPRRQARQVRKFNFFAAPSTSLRTCFAALREIFRVLVAA